ncbi:hypothetical protein Ahy_B09g095560 isoform B [Arachis hypogaea]|uniref:Uncharacterized protein n=1 Tax=Arachis hypogaea TaxID=3818 RepID=A0A444XF92_ARAHY|nr:hypothetical protein Ahy_B09g095560 isoform B [Arachis hypogaea]
MAARNQTKDLKCATHLLSDKFRNMSEEKKAIVRDLGFGGLMHIPPTKATTDSDTSISESETQEDSEDSGRKHCSKKGKKMDSRKRKKSQKESDSDSESESESSDKSEESSPVEKEKKKKKTKTTPKKTQPKKKKVVVEDSPPEEDQYFDGERYEISSDELDEWLRQNVDKSAAEGENQADLRSTEGRYVSSET